MVRGHICAGNVVIDTLENASQEILERHFLLGKMLNHEILRNLTFLVIL